MADKPNNRRVQGYIIRYNSRSKALTTLPSGRKIYERFAPGAFAESVAMINAGVPIKVNVEHMKDNALTALGSTAYNVQVEHRSDGVFATIDLLDDSISDDVLKRMTAGILRGASIEFAKWPGFEPTYTETTDGYVRTFAKAALTGFAVVDTPAYADAQLAPAAGEEPVFSRSISQAETEKIAAEAKIFEESLATRGQKMRIYYEHVGYSLGIRLDDRDGD